MKKVLLSGLLCLMASMSLVASRNNDSQMAKIAKIVGSKVVTTVKVAGKAAKFILDGASMLAGVVQEEMGKIPMFGSEPNGIINETIID